MSGSVYGKNFQISTWGESHGVALGVVIDGCPSGIYLCEEDIQKELDKRKPGSNPYATKRKESDKVEILSGIFEGKTTGTPISLIVYNQDQRSKDYGNIKDNIRPAHADYTFNEKYGFRDYRGGGRSSGRETLSRVAGGAIAKKILKELNIDIKAFTYSIGEYKISKVNLSEMEENLLLMPDLDTALMAQAFLDNCIEKENSAGGIIQCEVSNLKAGIGETVFDKLDASLAKAMISIGAVKGIEFGLGFESTRISGYENNDEFYFQNNKVQKYTNNSGGVLGGLSDGSKISFKVAFKPTPSIHKTQKTINTNNENIEINIKGRHDPVIIPRAVVVVEAMCAITLVDLIFSNMFSKMSSIKNLYNSL